MSLLAKSSAHLTILGITTMGLSLHSSQAQPPANRGPSTVVYDIRNLVARPEVLASRPWNAFKQNLGERQKEPAQIAAAIVQAVVSNVDSLARQAKPIGPDTIQVLNGNKLSIRANASTHREIAQFLEALHRMGDLYVVAKAELYEVDDDFYTKLKNAPRIDFDELERRFLAGTLPKSESLFKRLEKQKPLVTGDEVKVDSGFEIALLSRHHAVTCLPSPAQVHKGEKSRQAMLEGVSFLAGIHISGDRRYVRMKLIEKAAELREIKKVKVFVDNKDLVEGEIPFMMESTHSRVEEFGDGAATLVPVHYRPRSLAEKNRWWVLSITARIYIPEEEELRKLQEKEKAQGPGGQAPIPEARILEGHKGSVMSVAFSPDGTILASGSRDRQVRLWHVQTGKLQRMMTDHKADVYAVAFSPDGKLLASGSGDKTIRLWDVQAEKARSILEGHADIVRSVAFSPDGKILASGSVDKTVRLWDVETGKVLRTMTGHGQQVRSVAFSPDGRRLASAGPDKTMRLWDADTGAVLAVMEGHASSVEVVAWSPNGNSIASGSNDSTVRLWDPAQGTLRLTLKGHGGEVDSVAFSPNGKWMVSGSKDKTIKWWDPQTGALQQTWTGHKNRVESLAFSPDGKTLASGSGGPESLVRIWDLKVLEK